MDEGRLPVDFTQGHELFNLYRISIIWRQPLRLTVPLILLLRGKLYSAHCMFMFCNKARSLLMPWGRVWCNWEAASHDTWFSWTTLPWPPLRPPSWRRLASLESDVHPWSRHRQTQNGCRKRSCTSLWTLWDARCQIEWGQLSLSQLSQNIVQSQASEAFPPPSAECSNVCVIMMSPSHIKGVASKRLEALCSCLNWCQHQLRLRRCSSRNQGFPRTGWPLQSKPVSLLSL